MIRRMLLSVAALLTLATSAVSRPGLWLGGAAPEQPIVPARALPALPLPVGTKVMGLGHSFLGRGTYSRYSAAQTASAGLQGSDETPEGYLYAVKALDGRFNLDSFASATLADRPPSASNAVTGSQQGISGDHLESTGYVPGTLNRSRYALSRQPGIVVLDIGTNDVATGLTGRGDNGADAIIADLDRQIAVLTSHGVWVVVKTLAWRFDFANADDGQGGDRRNTRIIPAINRWILAQADRPGVKPWDTTAIDGLATTDHSTADTAQTGSADGVHPTAYGTGRLALSLLSILQPMVTAGDPRNLDPLSANLFPLAGLPGAAGTKGAGITGSVATGLTVTRTTGTSTAVASKEVIAIGNEKQVLTITPVADGTLVHKFTLSAADLNFATLGVADGDWLEVDVPIELNDWPGWTWYGTSTGSGAVALYSEQNSAASFVWETNTATGNGLGGRALILTTKLPVQAGMLAANRLRWSSRPIQIQFRSTARGIGIVKIGSPVIRKIADPRAAWLLP